MFFHVNNLKKIRHVLKDCLRKLEKDGNAGWLESYEGGTAAEKKEIINRLTMCLDNANLLVKEKESCGKTTKSQLAKGWKSLWEVVTMLLSFYMFSFS